MSLEDIIQSAVTEASDPVESFDADTGATIEADVVVDETPIVEADAEVIPDPPAKVEVDELTAELESLGIHAPKAGERENRLPYSRVKKIVENARKKLVDSHATTIKEHGDKLTAAEKRLKDFDAADNLSRTDAKKYLELLTIVNPEFKQYLAGSQPAEVKPPVVDDPAPGPDAKFADGSVGYSAEGLEKLRAWDRRQAVADAQKLFDARLGPIEKANKEREDAQRAYDVRQAQIPAVRNQIATASKTWGKAFDDDFALQGEGKSEILKYMQANPDVPFDSCVAAVLVPKVQSNRETLRAEWLKEQQARPAAAARTPGSTTKVGSEATGPRSMEDIIREQVATLKR